MKTDVTKIIGYILLSPALVSVLIFFINVITGENYLSKLKYVWTGSIKIDFEHGGGGGGFTSALPFYFGLMAIAGAYLIKDKK
jgi:hypothetical protein